jgi:protein-disulfide isomerase
MLKKIKPKNFPTKLFISVSIAALILLPVFFYFLKSTLIKNSEEARNQYYTDNLYDTSDPYITKVPSIKDRIKSPITDGADPKTGAENATVTIVEFSDFECEFCGKQEKIISEVMNEFKDKVKLIWKDYPDNNPNSPSYQAAVAGRCADEQNKFWPYHDLLFKESQNLNKQSFLEIAEELNLSKLKFAKCLESDEAKKLVDDNILEANALELNGVPFIYVNDKEILGEITADELKSIIETELKK